MDYSCDVSVKCIVYNHAKYLRQCLDGFVMQKGVKFEVIIHDDASTDGSADIIREYERNYPEIFKPIYQTENQYSQGKSCMELVASRLTGKYTAFCEGDDYWTDPFKLKKQFDALENHPECSFSTHFVKTITESGERTEEAYPMEYVSPGIVPGERILETQTFCLFQTSSYFMRTDAYFAYLMTEFRKLSTYSGDFPLLLYCSTLGAFYYFEEEMSNYRRGSLESWTLTIYENPEKVCGLYRANINVLCAFNDYSDHKYMELVYKRILTNKHLIYEANSNKKELFDSIYFECLNAYGIRDRMIAVLFDLCPSLKTWYAKRKSIRK